MSVHWLEDEAHRIPDEGPKAWAERVSREHSDDLDGVMRMLATGGEDLVDAAALALGGLGCRVRRLDAWGGRLVFSVVGPGVEALVVPDGWRWLPDEPGFAADRADEPDGCQPTMRLVVPGDSSTQAG